MKYRKGLSKDQLILLAINAFGSGNHPEATAETMEFFNKDYILDCLEHMYDSPKIGAFIKSDLAPIIEEIKAKKD